MTGKTLVRTGIGVGFALAALAISAVVGEGAEAGAGMMGRALPFVIAALIAVGTNVGIGIGLIALVVALGENALAPTAGLLDVIVIGGTLGCLGRALESTLNALSGSRWALPLAACFFMALLWALPDSHVLLAGPDGRQLTLDTTVQSATTAIRSQVAAPAWVPFDAPLQAAHLPLALLSVLAGVLLVAARGNANAKRFVRVAFFAVLAVGVLGVIASGMSVVTLLGGEVPIDGDALRRQWTLGAGGTASYLAVNGPDAGHLALWSRPYVDVFRLLMSGALCWLCWSRLRDAKPGADGATSALTGAVSVTPWLAGGLVFAVVAAIFSSSAIAYGGFAAAALALGALVGGRLLPRTSSWPGWWALGAALALSTVWLLPASGWAV